MLSTIVHHANIYNILFMFLDAFLLGIILDEKLEKTSLKKWNDLLDITYIYKFFLKIFTIVTILFIALCRGNNTSCQNWRSVRQILLPPDPYYTHSFPGAVYKRVRSSVCIFVRGRSLFSFWDSSCAKYFSPADRYLRPFIATRFYDFASWLDGQMKPPYQKSFSLAGKKSESRKRLSQKKRHLLHKSGKRRKTRGLVFFLLFLFEFFAVGEWEGVKL